MTKVLIGTIVGIFLGAFAVEILKKKSPKTYKAITDQATQFAASVAEVLHEGEAQLESIINDDPPAQKRA